MLGTELNEFYDTDVHSTGSQLRVVYKQVILSLPITSSGESFRVLRKIWDDELIEIQEQVYVLFLNNNNQVICYRCLHTGTTNQTLFDIKLALACALGCLAVKVIIAHNHPSGNLRPSPGDIAITEQFKDASELMDIDLLDHLIINQNDYYSFKDNRLVF
jgi:DNA repair protein RadC